MIKIVEAIKTCIACPSQWECLTEDNIPIYIRFRHGRLSVRIGKIGEDIYSAVEGEEIFYWSSYDELDGCMDYDELKILTQDILELPKDEIEDEEIL